MNLKGKVIIITGASSGIGKGTAIRASEEGALVAILGRDKNRLEETIGQLQGSGHMLFSFDITDYSIHAHVVKQIAECLGRIDGFVHCAGIEKTIPFNIMTPNVYRELFEVNVIAGMEMAKIISRKNFSAHTGASFVFVSSVKGRLGSAGNVGYCATKGALLPAVKSLAIELAKKKIRCNSVLPGIVKTELVDKLFNTLSRESVAQITESHPLGIGLPENVASLICFLLSDMAKWITGSDIVIDGGYSAK